jgi:hypothetical protein
LKEEVKSIDIIFLYTLKKSDKYNL